MRKSSLTHVVEIDGHHVRVREIGSSRPAVGLLLGIDRTASGDRYYVDRLLLPPGDRVLNEEWEASGAVSTVLTRRSTAQAD